MQAIILNSGIGSRLKKYTMYNPKCMVSLFDDETIIQYQLKRLQQCGIKKVTISTGYMHRQLKEYIEKLSMDINFEFVYNEEYFKTNYIVSMDKIYNIEDDILLLHGDLVFSSYVLQSILDKKTSCVVVDTLLPLPEKDFKAKVLDGKVVKIGINYFGKDCVTLQPMYYLKKQDWLLWKKEIREFCIAEKTGVYAEEAFNKISDKICLEPFDIQGALCNEIDNEEDLFQIRKRLKEEKV
ncbi:MAG: sugar phosphate nucleotidyltransferase [Lachnospiraceae bacterium]|nr:sugar phosphate nucleotidyltransferase [Lachnospiraceae bacterium]